MDPNVHTKMPDNKRTKYIIIVLLAVIVVLSYQLYKENKLKKDLVRRKAFLYKKLNQCYVDGEKSEAKYSNVRKEKMKLNSDLEDKTEKHEKLSKDYDELQRSFDKKEMELHSLQKSADEDEKQLSKLKANYDSAISSVRTVQGKVNKTLVVCNKNKEENIQFKEKVEGLMEQLQQCKDDKSQIEQGTNYISIID
ncbi:myosin-9-like isoform X1 [Xenia sp. Carnegie-2017]|uniref:myosin-9-like isoform X1 n=1 Tax=Xenia sp. Carnegie-2017 TaxID=2897299 RepID=UPI001F04B531|nr:myosin-9-like isoform X1 [Xenia sp. Carnegie-2017]